MGSSLRILLLEDNPADAFLAKTYLEEDTRRQYEVTHFSSLAESVGWLSENDCDAALLDLFLPDSRGLETVHAFRERAPEVATVVLSGLGDEALALAALEVGAQDYVVKSQLDAPGLTRSLLHAIARHKLERDLSATEQRYRELFEHSVDGVARTSPDGSILEMNAAFRAMLGYTEAEAKARTFRREDVVDVLDPRLPAALEERRRTGRFRGELNFRRKDGSTFPVELTTNSYADTDGLERTSMIVRDMSQTRRIEERLVDYQKQLARTEEMSLLMNVHTSLDGRWLKVPPRLCKLLGYEEHELLQMRYQQVTHPEDMDRCLAIDSRLIAGQAESLEVEKRYLCRDGRSIWVYINASVVTDRDDRPLYIQKYVRDITAERSAEEQAIQSYELLVRRIATLAERVGLARSHAEVYRVLFDFAREATPADSILVANVDPLRAEWTSAFAATTAGDACSEFVERTRMRVPPEKSPLAVAKRTRKTVATEDASACVPLFELVPRLDADDDRSRSCIAVPMSIDEDVIGVVELWSPSAEAFTDGHVMALEMAAGLAAIASQNLGLLEMQRLARNEAEAGRARLESVLEQAPALMATVEGSDHVFTFANSVYLEFFGGRDIIGRRVADVMPEIEAQGIIAILDRVYATGVSFKSDELSIDLDRHGDGNVRRYHFKLVYQPLRDAEGVITGVLADAVDITEQVQARMEAERLHAEIEAAYEHTIAGWARALDLRDEETAGHSQRVTVMTVALARQLGMSEDELVLVRRGALLHDIGKMGVPDSILLKPGELTRDEWEIMKGHTLYGRDLLEPISFLEPVIDIPHCHHEKWDGTGYPRGLKGEQIPLVARIFAVVDVYDALLSNRPYREAWPQHEVVAYLREQSGHHFDPEIVPVFLGMLDSLAPAGRRDHAEASFENSVENSMENSAEPGEGAAL